MKKLFYTLVITLGVSVFAITTASAENVAVTANFRAASAVAGGVNTGGLNADASGTSVDGGLLYDNGSDVLKLQLTIDDTDDTGAIFTAILTIEGVRENPDDLPTPPDGILTAPTGGHILMNGSKPAPDNLARIGDEVTLSIGSFVQTSGPAASISFEGYTNVSLDQINNGTAGAKSFTFGDTSFVGPGGGTNGAETISISGATDVAGEVFDGTGTERFRWRSVEASFNATVGIPGDFNNDGDVDVDDVDMLSSNYGPTGANTVMDLNSDGTIDLVDHDLHITTQVMDANGTGALVGDLNLDGDVDVSQLDFSTTPPSNVGDASVLLASLGQTSGQLYGDGDLNGDGDVDVSQLDFSTTPPSNVGDASRLLANLGQTTAPGGAPANSAVPEPGCLTMLALAGIAGMICRRKS